MTCEHRGGAIAVGRASRPTVVCVKQSFPGVPGVWNPVPEETCALCGTTPLL